MASGDDKTMRWARLGGLGLVLAVGWVFIAWQNHFHFTPPLVFASLGFLAVVLTTYNLWRTGAAAVAANEEDDGDASWGKPTGARGELEREKRTMLKAIKEAEFDHAMGKLSKADAEQMIGMYRARAIEVLKELEQLELGEAGTVRERILREVKARIAIEGKLDKDKAAPGDKKVDSRSDLAADDSGMTVASDAEDVKRAAKSAAAETKVTAETKSAAEPPADEPTAAAAAADEPKAAVEEPKAETVAKADAPSPSMPRSMSEVAPPVAAVEVQDAKEASS